MKDTKEIGNDVCEQREKFSRCFKKEKNWTTRNKNKCQKWKIDLVGLTTDWT